MNATFHIRTLADTARDLAASTARLARLETEQRANIAAFDAVLSARRATDNARRWAREAGDI